MSARVIPENSLITLSTGKELLSWSISLPNLFFLPFRVPENCAHSVVTHPTDPPPRPTKISPRPHSQLNSGTVVVNPSKDIAEAVYHYLKTSDKVPTFAFPDQDLLSAFFEGKWRPIPWYYNALKALRHVHPKEWSDDEVRCVHYIFPEKPWQRRVDSPEVEE
jgi:lipopolysaccharide biosynthesis glycosyltransferase